MKFSTSITYNNLTHFQKKYLLFNAFKMNQNIKMNDKSKLEYKKLHLK